MGRGKKNLGDWGENLAINFLRRHGFEIIDKNFFTPYGELDIVAKKGNDIYFVEVKTRRDSQLARDQAIDSIKIKKLEKTAKVYCYKRQIPVGKVSIVFAGMIIFVDKIKKSAKIRFVVLSGFEH